METLGSLIDKLTVMELKIWHHPDRAKTNLLEQKKKLCDEIDKYIVGATVGKIGTDDLTFDSNKVYDTKIPLPNFRGGIGELSASLCAINCEIWHRVDQSYHVENLSQQKLADLVKQLAVLNLQRNKCIDAINTQFKGQVML